MEEAAPETEEFWDDILGHVVEHDLIPLVGPDLLTYPSPEGPTTLQRLVAERLALKLKLAVRWTEGSPLNDVARAFLAAHDPAAVDRLYRLVQETLRELAPTPPEPLRQLAAIRDLDVFVSTTADSLLAQALNAERFQGAAQTRELWFAPNQATERQRESALPPIEGEPVVFKLFGHMSAIPQYVLHDEDLVEWLHALVSEEARLPDWLTTMLRNRALLLLGCRVADWVGRFLVRTASTTRLTGVQRHVFIVGSPGAGEVSLAQFLQAHCGPTRVQALSGSPVEFVAALHQRWSERSASSGADEVGATPVKRGTIFISYAREDVEAARRLCHAIEALGGDVWLDERRLLPGDRWNQEILGVIRRQARLVIAVLSRNTERTDEGYVFREWREAIERQRGIPVRRFLVPTVIDPDPVGPDAFRQLPEPEEFRKLDFGRAPLGEPDAALRAMLQQEIRASRRESAA